MPERDDSNGAAPLPALAEPASGEVLDPAAGPAPLAQRVAELPAPVVAAAGGFLAGVATFVAVRILRRAAAAPAGLVLRRGRRRDARRIEATRSFLVDVHLLKR